MNTKIEWSGYDKIMFDLLPPDRVDLVKAAMQNAYIRGISHGYDSCLRSFKPKDKVDGTVEGQSA